MNADTGGAGMALGEGRTLETMSLWSDMWHRQLLQENTRCALTLCWKGLPIASLELLMLVAPPSHHLPQCQGRLLMICCLRGSPPDRSTVALFLDAQGVRTREREEMRDFHLTGIPDPMSDKGTIEYTTSDKMLAYLPNLVPIKYKFEKSSVQA